MQLQQYFSAVETPESKGSTPFRQIPTGSSGVPLKLYAAAQRDKTERKSWEESKAFLLKCSNLLSAGEIKKCWET